MLKPVIASSVVLLSAVSGLAFTAGSADAGAREFANCTAMHRVYPHGVGKFGAHDHTSGTPVTNFKRSNALYFANKKSDRDGDHIACEQR